MRLAFVWLSPLFLSLSLAACGDDSPGPLDAGTTQGAVGDAGADAAVTGSGLDGGPVGTPLGGDASRPSGGAGCAKMDILFVIDNSGSMGEEQDNLAANFPRFIEVLDGFREGALEYRLGVTTTAIGGDFELFGAVQASGAAGELLRTADMTEPWLDRGDPDLAATFSQLATVGLNGSAVEQPLRAAKHALVDRLDDGTNTGFRRDDALLALVFLTDEDDGSREEGGSGGGGLEGIFGDLFTPDAPVASFVDAYDAAAMGRERWAASVIAGDQEPSCSSEFGDADYAERLIEFVELAGSQATFGSICSGDLSAELDAALQTFSAACETFVPLI